jgi:ABC-type multidrug transport system fused ATPase/permease subunit
LADKIKITEKIKEFAHLDRKDEELNQKLSEFITLLEQSELDSQNIKSLQSRVNGALQEKLTGKGLIHEIKEVSLADLNKFDQLDQLEFLLNNNHLDSKQINKINFAEKFTKFIKIVIGFLFVTLGFAMIIMPAPPYFEMFTIFYFNPNDGVTLMDLISLIIIAVGIYIIIKTISQTKKYE